MKSLMALCVVGVLALANVVRAEDAKPKQEPMCCMFLQHADLLNKEQKEKATALHVACAKEQCSKDAQATFFKSVKALLSPEQIAQCKADCEKNHRTGCPICSEAKAK